MREPEHAHRARAISRSGGAALRTLRAAGSLRAAAALRAVGAQRAGGTPSAAGGLRAGGALFAAASLLVAASLLSVSACSFGGYVPKEKVAPLSTVERRIIDLQLDLRIASELDCARDLCGLRYRVYIDRPGILTVRAWGPPSDDPGQGPRIAQLALEGPAQAVLGVSYGAELEAGEPLAVRSKVGEGLHFVLVQALGGVVPYELEATFESSGAAPTRQVRREAEAGPTVAGPTGPVVPGRSWRGSQQPGDVSDGADFAFDPRAQIDRFRKYDFAQDPLAQVQGKAPPGTTNPFVEKQVQRQVSYYLANLGFEKVSREEAELLFAVNVGSRSSTWYSFGPTVVDRSYDNYFQQWTAQGAFVRQHTYTDGTLVIDIVDTNTGDLVWHGWTTEAIPIAPDSDQLIKDAVKSVLDQLGGR